MCTIYDIRKYVMSYSFPFFTHTMRQGWEGLMSSMLSGTTSWALTVRARMLEAVQKSFSRAVFEASCHFLSF